MSKSMLRSFTWLGFVSISALVSFSAGSGQWIHWPSFRGTNASGIAEGYPTPLEWDVASSRGIRWRTPVPGLGHSSPAIWGDRVFITTAVGGPADSQLRVGLYGDISPVENDPVHAFKVLCLDKRSGKVLWERDAYTGLPRIKRHPKSTHANPTVATDGRHVVAFFGSHGLHCYDFKGKLLWSRDFGVLDSAFFVAPEAQWGFASSPVIHEGLVIIQCDVLKGSFLAALDITSGRDVWRTVRDDVPTWSTPAVWAVPSGPQVIVNGFRHIGGYDARTGKEIWKLRGGGDIPVPTPVTSDGLAFITNAHGGKSPIYAVRADAQGEITPAEGSLSSQCVAWSHPRDGAYMQTPIVYAGNLYVCKDNGVLSCFAAATGQRLFQERLSQGTTGFSASAVAGDGKIYYTSEEGDVYVLQAGAEFKLLKRNSLDEVCMATPALSEGVLYFRTRGHLVAVDGSTPPR